MTLISDHADTQLWCSVIHQALDDATSPNKEAKRERDAARTWFQDAKKDFRYVCQLADMDHEQVRAAALKKIADADAREDTPKGPQMLEHNGERLSVNEWAQRLGIHPVTIQTRLKNGRSVEQALTPGHLPRPKSTYEYKGKPHTVEELAAISGLSVSTLYSRLKNGWPVDEALTVTTEESKRRRADAMRKSVTAKRGPKAKLHEHAGMSKTLRQWADHYRLSFHTLRKRLNNGWTLERVLTQPSRQAPKTKAA